MYQMQRIISKHQHTDGLIALYPQHQMSGDISYDFGPSQEHGTLSNVSSRYSDHSVTRGHYMNASKYDAKLSSYNDIYSATLANPNLLLNGDFETAGAGDPDFWASWNEFIAGGAPLADEGAIVNTGARAAKFTYTGFGLSAINQVITVVAGKKYRLRFAARGDGTVGGRYQIYDISNVGNIVALTVTGVTAAVYTRVDVEFTAPVGCTSIRVYFYGPTAVGSCYVDTAEVKKVTNLDFNPDAGAAFVFMKTDAAWAEGINRYAIKLAADANNQISIYKTVAADTVYVRYESNNNSKLMDFDGLTWTTMGWSCVGVMWDRLVNNKVRVWLDGVDTDGGVDLKPWFGDLAANLTVIGASANDGSDPWDGGLGIVALYNQVLSDEQMAWLSKP